MKNRLLKLRNEMVKRRLDAVLVSSLFNITYLTNFAGFSKDEREAFLLITQNKQYVLTDGRYSEAVRNSIRSFELAEVFPKLPFKKIIQELAKKHKIKSIGLEENNLTHSEYKSIVNYFDTAQYYSTHSIRNIKDEGEITKIEKACQLGDKTFKYILKKIKLGISEKELAFVIEFFIKKNGADISFRPIVAFGRNSAIPHHQTSDQRLKTKDIILLDFGVKLNNYCSDMTRTIFFGKPTNKQNEIYQTVLESQKRAIDYLAHCHSELVSESKTKTRSRNKFGMTGKNVDRIAREHIISRGYKTIPHSLGHGIGLEVHEAPHLSQKSKDILKPGMVFTIEPGIYIPGIDGVRIEDVVVLEKSKIKILTHSPKEIIQI